MPEGTKAKAVVCEIKGKTLKAGLKGQEPILQVSGVLFLVPESSYMLVESAIHLCTVSTSGLSPAGRILHSSEVR